MAGNETTDPVTPVESGGDDDRGYDVPNRPWLVHGAIVAAFLIFLSMVTLLFSRWWEAREPNSTMIFLGNEQLDGVQVRVDGPGMDKALTQHLTKENGYQAKFAMPAGTYIVRVIRDREVIVRDTAIEARDGVGMRYDMTRLINLSAPTTTTRPQ
jgi:hypothetical protein